MKKIYIILTHTGTALSRVIKSYTKDEFSHVSIALDKDLNKMYSFGRLHASNPFWAGFVHEYVHKGTFKRFHKTVARVYCLDVTDNQYEIAKNTIEEFEKEKKKYKFNIIGLFGAGFNKKITKKDYFYCAEFVKHVMDKAEIKTNLPEIVKPEDFKKIEGMKEEYFGLFCKYN